MTWKLFLDDVRDPPAGDWVLARSVEESKRLIATHGYPSVMSLDHDLGAEVPTGHDFLKDLIDDALDFGQTTELAQVVLIIHSANPVGRDNMESLWQSFSAMFKTPGSERQSDPAAT